MFLSLERMVPSLEGMDWQFDFVGSTGRFFSGHHRFGGSPHSCRCRCFAGHPFRCQPGERLALCNSGSRRFDPRMYGFIFYWPARGKIISGQENSYRESPSIPGMVPTIWLVDSFFPGPLAGPSSHKDMCPIGWCARRFPLSFRPGYLDSADPAICRVGVWRNRVRKDNSRLFENLQPTPWPHRSFALSWNPCCHLAEKQEGKTVAPSQCLLHFDQSPIDFFSLTTLY